MFLNREKKASKRGASETRLVTPTFVLVTSATFAYFISIGALIPTIPRFVEGPLGKGEAAVGFAVGAFGISAVLIRPFIGRLGDSKGRRVLMIGGSALVGISILGLLFVHSFLPLILLRLTTGIGEAAFYVGAASAINDLAPNERRGEALSFFSLALYGGLAVGPVLGESVLGTDNFSLAFIVAAAATLAATLIALSIPDTRPEFDPDEPVSARRRVVHPAGLLPGVILATSVWGLAGFNTLIPLYALQLGMSGSKVVFFTYSVIILGFRSLGARIPDRFGTRRVVRTALAFSTSGLVVMGIWVEPQGLFVGAAIFAIGQALAFPTLMALALSAAPARERGSVVGTFTAFFDLAFGLGALSTGWIAETAGYQGAFLIAAAVAALGFGLMIFFAKRGEMKARHAERVEEYQEPFA